MRRALLVLLFLCAVARVEAQVVPATEVRFTPALPGLLGITTGTGSPEGVLARCVGSVYLRRDGTAGATVYFKETGTCSSTGWTTGALGGGGGGSHSLLSTTHTDTVTNVPVRGALIVANSTPSWARFSIGSSGTFLRSDGTDPAWSSDGSGLTALNATSLTSGTVPDARLSANVSLLGSSISSSEITDATITFADWASNSCATDDVPKWSGSVWACAADEVGSGGGADAAASYLTRTAEGSLSNESNLGALTTGLLKITVSAGSATPSTATAATDYVAPGAATSSGLTMATARLLGRTTASTGAIEEITVGTGLSLAAGTLTATGGGACQEGEFDAGNSGTSITLDWDDGNQQIVTLNNNLGTLTLSNPVAGCAYRILFTQDGTGGRTVTFPGSIDWGALGSAPDVLTDPNAVTVCAFFYSGVNTNYQGFCDAEAAPGGSGAWSLRFTALSNIAPSSNPATFNTRNTTPVLEFDTTTQEGAQFLSVLPTDYASGGIQVCVHWAAASATSGTIGWDVAFERIGDGSQDLDSDGYGSASTITATTVPGTSGLVDITCVTATDGANIDSLAGGESFRLRIRRDVTNDTATGDAQLVAVDLREP